ncbi:hypothetical protein VTJ83DRAFT_4155 [Remersonia thermophila]|uniref:Mitochondrial pyruvate carrier n=1 Tax=Remersonia thermophila TaxID=72144 RepID=A0ABR4D980_9PEZI
MALAAVKAINARFRSNKVLGSVCSTHFWVSASNYAIPLAAIADTRKSPELISPTMTGALIMYSLASIRFSLVIGPKAYTLPTCHLTNVCAQLIQGYRCLHYYYLGGKESGKHAEAVAAGTAAAEAAKGSK